MCHSHCYIQNIDYKDASWFMAIFADNTWIFRMLRHGSDNNSQNAASWVRKYIDYQNAASRAMGIVKENTLTIRMLLHGPWPFLKTIH